MGCIHCGRQVRTEPTRLNFSPDWRAPKTSAFEFCTDCVTELLAGPAIELA